MYLLDTNIYISFYERYYPKENFPTFWTKFTDILKKNIIVIPKVVINETYQNEWFVTYLVQNYTEDFIEHTDYFEEWREVLQHIAFSPFYNDKALIGDRSWANDTIADGWLIAIAKKEGYTIVTDEVKNPNLNKISPSKSCKIPDIAADFGIRCLTMLEFFKEIKLKI